MKVIDCRIVPPFKVQAASRSAASTYDARMYGEMYFGSADANAFEDDSPLLKGGNIQDKAVALMEKNPADNLVRLLDDTGISRALFCGFDTSSVGGRVMPNEDVAAMQAKYPDRFIVLAGVDPYKGTPAVRQLDHALKNLKLKGMRIAPFELKMYPNDKRLYPFYEKLVEYDVPLDSHASVNFTQSRLMDFAHPKYLDEVACDFPDLKIIADHGGWPWINEMVAVAWRHYNFYICVSAIRIKYLATPESGWGMLLHYGNTVIQDKIVWGSTWPFLPIKRQIKETLELPLKDEVKEKWLYRNAARLFGFKD